MRTIEESRILLKIIFPNYPALQPRNPCPPLEEWPEIFKKVLDRDA